MDEVSAGAVVFRETPDGRRYLLLRNSGRWDFPKGGVEAGEGELDTVLREVKEETGLDDIEIIPGLRKVIEYFYRRGGRNIHKQVVYLLARTSEERVRISFEHQGYAWFTYKKALGQASYDNSKNILAEAEKFLEGRTEPGLRTERAGVDPQASPL